MDVFIANYGNSAVKEIQHLALTQLASRLPYALLCDEHLPAPRAKQTLHVVHLLMDPSPELGGLEPKVIYLNLTERRSTASFALNDPNLGSM